MPSTIACTARSRPKPPNCRPETLRGPAWPHRRTAVVAAFSKPSELGGTGCAACAGSYDIIPVVSTPTTRTAVAGPVRLQLNSHISFGRANFIRAAPFFAASAKNLGHSCLDRVPGSCLGVPGRVYFCYEFVPGWMRTPREATWKSSSVRCTRGNRKRDCDMPPPFSSRYGNHPNPPSSQLRAH